MKIIQHAVTEERRFLMGNWEMTGTEHLCFMQSSGAGVGIASEAKGGAEHKKLLRLWTQTRGQISTYPPEAEVQPTSEPQFPDLQNGVITVP